jgi:hypothetical protein
MQSNRNKPRPDTSFPQGIWWLEGRVIFVWLYRMVHPVPAGPDRGSQLYLAGTLRYMPKRPPPRLAEAAVREG